MKTHSSSLTALLMSVIFAGILAFPTAMARAQTVPTGSHFTLQVFIKPSSLEQGEIPCKYFLWTKDFTADQRISFTYVNPDRSTGGDVPILTDVTIVFNPADTVPVAIATGADEKNQTIWQLDMSQDTYDANAGCLKGIPVKSSP